MPIERVAVLGAGVMGGGIAAHLANAGLSVKLLDVPGVDGQRNGPAARGLEAVKSADPAALMHRRFAKRIEVGNFEDDWAGVSECDWVVEAVVERLDVKHALYRSLDGVLKPGAVLSSNTSTLPLSELVRPLPLSMRRSFLITHFFNPPRYMRLLEVVVGPDTDPALVERITTFCDVSLGKGVVRAHDTPGFIANRIGAMWLGLGVSAAVERGITVEEADAVIGGPFGIPRTGVFGLLDLVGLDLMPHVRASMDAYLPAEDPVRGVAPPPAFLERLIEDGYTGRKGKGGFYRLNREGGGRTKEGIDLETGQYRASRKASPACLAAAKRGGLAALFGAEDPPAAYAWDVMSETLRYACALVPEIADDIASVDAAMRLGFRWAKGPFELIDELGAAWFVERLKQEDRPVPPLLAAAVECGFYASDEAGRTMTTPEGNRTPVPQVNGKQTLADLKRQGAPLKRNRSASVWDLGDDVLCLEFHTKMNALDAGVIEMISHALAFARDRKGLVIHNDAENFSVGANAGLILFASHLAMWDMVELGLQGGQSAYKALKYAPFPVVGAPSGMARGGGCEILLHCDAVQAHAETYMGLVEVGVGLLPGWGGCKEMVVRWLENEKRPGGPMPAIQKAFELISLATGARSAEEARDHLFLLPRDRVTMSLDRLLGDAKERVLELADEYIPPQPAEVHLPGASAKAALTLAVESFRALGFATDHDCVVADGVADVLTGGDADIVDVLSEDDLLALERRAFLNLLRTAPTAARLEHMLTTGKPLRN